MRCAHVIEKALQFFAVFATATVVAGIIGCLARTGQPSTNALHSEHSKPGKEPLGQSDAYYKRFPPKPGVSYLPEPISCSTFRYLHGSVSAMPDTVIRAIGLGEGLPAVYYKTDRVPTGFCKPAHGIWTWPYSKNHFFDSTPALYQAQSLTADDREAIETVKRSLPRQKRYLLKWAHSTEPPGVLIFQLKPEKNSEVDNSAPYVGTIYSHGKYYPGFYVSSATGNIFPPPP